LAEVVRWAQLESSNDDNLNGTPVPPAQSSLSRLLTLMVPCTLSFSRSHSRTLRTVFPLTRSPLAFSRTRHQPSALMTMIASFSSSHLTTMLTTFELRPRLCLSPRLSLLTRAFDNSVLRWPRRDPSSSGPSEASNYSGRPFLL
jgi:hypothetical protein